LVNDETDADESLTQVLLDELAQIARLPGCQRSYSEALKKAAFALHTLSPKCYRLLREFLLFPSVSTIDERFQPEKKVIRKCLKGQDMTKVSELLRDYRIRYSVPEDLKLYCTLAFDATSASQTGIKVKNKFSENSFAFMMLPLSHIWPDLLIHSIPHASGRIDDEIRGIRDKLCEVMGANGFSSTFVATDGDTGVSGAHHQAFSLYSHFAVGVDLTTIVSHLTDNGTRDLTHWPISDLLHLMKNARARVVMGLLAFTSGARTINGDSLNEVLTVGRALTDCTALDLLKDELALYTFTLHNLLKLYNHADFDGAYFLLPFVALNLAVRNPVLTNGTRLDLIQAAFHVFFSMIKNYPRTGARAGIYEAGRAGTDVKKTFWTKNMCIRACNLCVGLTWAITTTPDYLALGRIGTHSMECLFGTTRSVLRGDTRWEKFLSAEVDAMMVRRVLSDLHVETYIRRFRNVSGHTLIPGNARCVHQEFREIAGGLEAWASLLACTDDKSLLWCDMIFIAPFGLLPDKLAEVGYVERIPQSSRTSGGAIPTRLFAATARGDLGSELTNDVLDLADA
jgi:hypothetical protein